MPARRYDLVCDDSERGKMRQRLIRQKIRSVGLSPGPPDLDKNSNIYTDITVVKSPRAPMYEVQYVKTRKDGIKQIPVVRSLPKNTAGKGDGDKSSQTTKTDGSEKSEVDETGSTVSQKSDVKRDDMVGLRVIACNRKDGLYYPGTVASHLESTYAMVNFNFNKRQKVRTHMIIPMSGAIPRPELAPGDFVLVKVFKQHVSLDCYVPAIIEFVPEDFRTHSKFYSVLLYNGQRASTMRKFIVKIGRSRFEVAVNYIAHIQQIERQKRVALSEATPRSQDTPTSKTTSEHTDRYEDVMSDHSSVRSSDRSSVKSEDRSSIRSGSERGRKKKEKVTKKLAQKKKEDERTKSRSEDKKQKHSRSSSRSSSRTKSKSRSRSRSEEKKQKLSKSSSRSSSRTKSKSRSRSRSKSRSTSRSRSRSRSRDSESTYSRSSNESSRKDRRSGSKDRPSSRSRSRAQTRSRGDSRSRTSSQSYSSRSRTRSRSSSRSRSRSYLSDASWVKSKNQRKSRSSSGSSTVKSKSRSPSNDNDRTPRASPIERPTNPVPKPRPSSQISPRRESSDPRSDIYIERSRSSKSRNSSEIVQFDEKDQVIGELQHQLDKQLRKQMRQERRLIRQARKINKIQRKLKHSDHNDSLLSDKTDRSRNAKSSSDTDGSPRRRKESPDGTSYRDSPDLQSMRKGVPGLEFDTEVLARWSDDGWYYRGRILKSDESKLVLMDTMGHLEEIVRDDVITEEGHRSDVVQPQDCVIALHPKYVFSYAPGEVLHVYGNGNINVEFYDGTLSKLAPGEVYKISKEKYKHDVEYIVEKEKELIGKSVVARDDRSGVFRLGVVDSRVGIGQQYYLKWLDGDMCKQTSTHIFEVSLRRINSEHLEHVLAPTDSRCVDYKPAVVLQREPLHLQFCDGYGNPDVRREQCFWINKDYYTNAVDFLLARQGGSQSTSTL